MVGNDSAAAALEVTLRGPKLKFHRAALVAVCGGEFDLTVLPAEGDKDGPKPVKKEVPMWTAFQVRCKLLLEAPCAALKEQYCCKGCC